MCVVVRGQKSHDDGRSDKKGKEESVTKVTPTRVINGILSTILSTFIQVEFFDRQNDHRP